MQYTIQNLQTILSGKLLNKEIFPATISNILFDSRKVIFPKNSIFFAIIGKRQDGHNFVADAYQKGLRHFVIAKKIEPSEFPNANFILVENTTKALQNLAIHHRQQHDLLTIGITGSNGKTIVKEWLFQLLHKDYSVVRSPKSYNSQIGVPLSVLRIKAPHNLGIFEAGISKVGEMSAIAPVIDAKIGIFTNIGEAHNEGFSSYQEKIKEKLQLFKNTPVLFYKKENQLISEAIEQLPNKHLIGWSLVQSDLLEIWEKDKTAKPIKHHLSVYLPFSDPASIENALHCWVVLWYLGFKNIEKAIQKLEPVAMRLELKEGINNCIVINDSYNSDLNALQIALDFLNQQSTHSRKTLILSDILQSGQPLKNLYEQVGTYISSNNFPRFIGIGKDIPIVKDFLSKKIETHFFPTTDAFLQHFSNENFKNETILLKGARPFAFERIANLLSKKVHKTVLEVNLDALINNLAVFHQYLNPETRLIAMVKASAYGSGSIEVARLLEFHNISYLAVVYADEGVELRRGGIQSPILVLNPEPATFDALFQYDLEPEIYNFQLLKQFTAALPEGDEIFPIHLKIDTGMHRLGFEANDIAKLLEILKNEPRLKVQSVFSHLAGSEDATHDDFTKKQIQTYLKVYDKIAKKLKYKPLRHILNSAGIVRFPEYQMDMVRLGIGLYGIDGSGLVQSQLQVVNTLKATISQIKNIPPNETVGYSRKGKAKKNMRIATVSIGYADGLLRRAGNGRYSVLIRGQHAPIFGNVCMDMCMVDITQIQDAQEGDEVIIFGKNPRVEELAESLETISYEVFTSISQRVKRIYIQE